MVGTQPGCGVVSVSTEVDHGRKKCISGVSVVEGEVSGFGSEE